MRLLPDTHILLWAAAPEDAPKKLQGARRWLLDPQATVFFSVASIWEVAIKSARGSQGFDTDPEALRSGLLAQGWAELAISGSHVTATTQLPMLHQDPFDRLIRAQATVEHMTLLTADATLAQYPGAVITV